ncbi:cyclase, partial [Kocuria sp. CPCC 205263]
GVEHAAASRGDDGKAGVSGKAVAAGIAAAGVAAAGVAAAAKKKDSGPDTEPVTFESTAPPAAPAAPVSPGAPGETVTGEVPPIPPVDETLADDTVDADPGVDPATRRIDDRPAGGPL